MPPELTQPDQPKTDEIEKMRSLLTKHFTDVLSGPEPQAPLYQPAALTPVQSYAQARNPALAGQLESAYQAPGQARYAQQQAAFEQAMDTRKQALGGAVSMVNADASLDARLAKRTTRYVNTEIPKGHPGAGQPIIIAETTDAMGNLVDTRYVGPGRNPTGVLDTNYGLLFYSRYGDPFAGRGGGEQGKPTGPGPAAPASPTRAPNAPSGPHVMRSDLQKKYGADAAGMARAETSAKQRGIQIVEDAGGTSTTGAAPGGGTPSLGAGGFVEVGGRRAMKTPSDIMVQTQTNQENLRGAFATAEKLWGAFSRKSALTRGVEQLGTDLPLIGGKVRQALGYFDPEMTNTKQALDRVSQILNYLVSGKQISEDEYARLRPNVPDIGDAPADAAGKIQRFKDELGRIESVRGAMLPGFFQGQGEAR